jgi:hypothetical protein
MFKCALIKLIFSRFRIGGSPINCMDWGTHLIFVYENQIDMVLTYNLQAYIYCTTHI